MVKNKNKACVPTPLVSLYVIIILPLPKIRAKRLLQVVYNWHGTIKVMFHKILFMQMPCLCHFCDETMVDHGTMLFLGHQKYSAVQISPAQYSAVQKIIVLKEQI